MLSERVLSNPVVQKYRAELVEMRPAIIQYFSAPDLSQYSVKAATQTEGYMQRVLEIGALLEELKKAIEATAPQDTELMQSMDRAAAQLDAIPDVDMQDIAQKSTLELLNLTAQHLAGRAVTVCIQEPQNGRAVGETFYDGDALKIAVSPRAVFDGDRYLRVFLHEVAHAKLHMSADCNTPGWKMEDEAQQQAQYWTAYARKNLNPMLYVGEGAPAARVFRSRLITLLGSREAAETIGTY
jgi:hypothetical protein